MALLKHLVRVLLATSIVRAAAVEYPVKASVETSIQDSAQALSRKSSSSLTVVAETGTDSKVACAASCYDVQGAINNCKFKTMIRFDCLCKVPNNRVSQQLQCCLQLSSLTQSQVIKYCSKLCQGHGWKDSDANVCGGSSRVKSTPDIEPSTGKDTTSDSISDPAPASDSITAHGTLRERRDARKRRVTPPTGQPYKPFTPPTSCGMLGITCAQTDTTTKRDAEPVAEPVPEPIAEPKPEPAAEPQFWEPQSSCGVFGITCADSDTAEKRDAEPVSEPIPAPKPEPSADPQFWEPQSSCGVFGITCADSGEVNDKREAAPIPDPIAEPKPEPAAEPQNWEPPSSCGVFGITCADTDKRDAELEERASPSPTWSPSSNCGVWGETCASAKPNHKFVETTLETIPQASATATQ